MGPKWLRGPHRCRWLSWRICGRRGARAQAGGTLRPLHRARPKHPQGTCARASFARGGRRYRRGHFPGPVHPSPPAQGAYYKTPGGCSVKFGRKRRFDMKAWPQPTQAAGGCGTACPVGMTGQSGPCQAWDAAGSGTRQLLHVYVLGAQRARQSRAIQLRCPLKSHRAARLGGAGGRTVCHPRNPLLWPRPLELRRLR